MIESFVPKIEHPGRQSRPSIPQRLVQAAAVETKSVFGLEEKSREHYRIPRGGIRDRQLRGGRVLPKDAGKGVLRHLQAGQGFSTAPH